MDGKDYLMHHGILGMKWGVQNGPPYPLDQKNYSEVEKRFAEYTKSDKNEDYVIQKGTQANRVGRNKEIDDHNRTYITTSERDKHVYRYESGEGGIAGRIAISLKTNKDLKIAKGKALRDAYTQMLKTTSLDEFVNQHGQGSWKMNKADRKKYEAIYKNALKDQKSFDESYKDFQSGIIADTELSKKYFNYLQKQGYDGMFDYNDGGYAETPAIIFDRAVAFKTVGQAEIDKLESEKWLYEHGHFNHSTFNDTSYLAHHGILGMHWGDRNGPPYPLSKSAHSSSENKAGWTKSLKKGVEAIKKTAKKIDDDVARRKQIHAEKQEVKWQKNKAKIMATGDIRKAQKNASKLSNEELSEIIDRYRALKNFDQFVESEKAGKKYVQNIANDVIPVKQPQPKTEAQPQQPKQQNQQNQSSQLKKANVMDKVQNASETIKKVGNSVDNVRQTSEKIINAYNTGAKIINAVGGKNYKTFDINPKEERQATRNTVYDADGNKTSETINYPNGDRETHTYKTTSEKPKNESESKNNNSEHMNAGQDYFKRYYGDYDKKKKG